MKVTKQELELADKIGQFIEYWGFKEVHGRIWTLIFLSPQPVDAGFLIENLGVSKALVSMSLKDLLHFNVILPQAKGSPSTQKYTHNPDILGVISEVLQNREAKMLIEIRVAHELLSRAKSLESSPISVERLEALGQMIGTADTFLNCLLALKNIDTAELGNTLQLKR